MIIDVHTHYRSKHLLEELIKRGFMKLVVDSDGKKHIYDRGMYKFTMPDQYAEPNLEKRIEYLDQYGIDMQVLSTPLSSDYSAEDGPELARMSNDGIAEVVRKYPRRFIGLASIPIRNRTKSLDELERAIHELGFKGVCIGANIEGIPLDSDYLWPFYKKVVELDIPIFVHPGFPPGAGQMNDYGLIPIVGFEFELILAQVRIIYGGVLEEFPTLKFIFSHLGGGSPFLKERIENGWEFAKMVPDKKARISKSPCHYLELFYFETVSFYKPAIMCTIQCSGVDNLLFGTDYPLYPLGDIPYAVKIMNELDLCQSDKKKILCENAKRLFKI